MIKMFRPKIKPEKLTFNYERACEKKHLNFNEYTVEWLSKFGLRVLSAIGSKKVNGMVDFVIMDERSLDDCITYYVTVVGGRKYEITDDFVENYGEAINKYGGKPVIITDNNITDNAYVVAKVLGVEIINSSMIAGINNFILGNGTGEIKEDSEMFINRLTYYIKKTLQKQEV